MGQAAVQMSSERPPRFRWVWGLFGVAIILSASLVGFLQSNEYARIEKAEMGRLQTLARVIDANLVIHLKSMDRLLLGVRDKQANARAQSLSLAASLTQEEMRYLVDTTPGVLALSVLDKAGNVLVSNNADQIGMNFFDRPYFQLSQETRDQNLMILSELFSPIQGTYVLTLSRPVLSTSGLFQGAIVLALDPEFFKSMLNSSLYEDDLRCLLIHQSGRVFQMAGDAAILPGADLAKPGFLLSVHQATGQRETLVQGVSYSSRDNRMGVVRNVVLDHPAMDKFLVIAFTRNVDKVFANWRREAIITFSTLLLFLMIGGAWIAFYQRQQRAMWWRNRELERERQRVAAAQEAAALEIEDLYNNAPVGYHSLGPDGTILRINDTALRWWGYERNELVGWKKGFDLLAPACQAIAREAFVRLKHEGSFKDLRLDVIRKDGSVMPLLFSSTAVRDERGHFRESRATSWDMSERLKVELRLEEAQRTAQLGSWEVDLAANTVSWSAEMYRLYEVDPLTRISRQNCLSTVHPDDVPRTVAQIDSGIENQLPFELIHRVRSRNGILKYIRVRGEAEYGDGGVALRYAGTAQDVTLSLQQEQALKESETRYRQIVEDQTELVGRYRADGTMLFVNQAYARYFGLRPQDIIGRSWHPEAHPDDIPAIEQQLKTLTPEHPVVVIENRVFAAANELRWLQFSNLGIFDAHGQLCEIQSVGRDITDRKRIENELRENESRLSRVLAGSDQGFWDWDLQTNTFTVSARFETMLGYAPGEMDLRPEHWAAYVHQDDLQASMHSIQRVLDGLSPIHEVELRCQEKAGEWRWVLTRGAVVVRDANGRPLTMSGTHTDITERKQLEAALDAHRNDLEQQIARRTRELVAAKDAAESANQAKTTFLTMMSHELRTPMNGLLGMLGLLRRTALTDKQKGFAEKIRFSAHQLLGLIEDVLDFARIEQGQLKLEKTSFLIDDVIRDATVPLVEAIEGKGLQFHVNAPSLPTRVIGDRRRIVQALVNLLSNAVKFTHQGSIGLTCTVVEESDATIRLEFDVSDTGIGIDAKDRGRIFERFEQADASSTRAYGGSGLGLAITRSIARLMEGDVEVVSEVGKGSTFKLTLNVGKGNPVASDGATPDSEAMASLKSIGRGCRVLVVDDDRMTGEIVTKLLVPCGLIVDVAENGAQALDRVGVGDYSLILMDIQMPIMDGYTATRRIREMPAKAGAPILALTANVLEVYRKEAIAAGMNDFISKPVDIEKLLEVVLKWLRYRME